MNHPVDATPAHSLGQIAESLRPRTLERLVLGQETSDGAGVRLRRVLTQDLQQRLDPFLMLDAFGSDDPDDYIAGFPDHPHRGFETITYMIQGRMLHRDSAGHEGLLQSGGMQWMTAGRGVVHSEIPQQQSGLMEGFQLWLNLPAERKLCAPWYRDVQAQDIPRLRTGDGVELAVLAGSSHGVQGAVQRELTEPLYLDLRLPAGSRFSQPLPAGHNAFVYVYRGALRIGDAEVPAQRMGILGNDPQADGVVLHALADSRALLVAGRPLRQPIVQYGPFVMNTAQQIHDALRDFREGRIGGYAG